MKKLAICGMLLAIVANQAMAERGIFYVEGKFGGSHGQANDFTISDGDVLSPNHFGENVYVWGGAVGYTYKPWPVPLRMEVEYLYRNRYNYSPDETFDGAPVGTIYSQYTNTQTILGNAYFDIPVSRMFAFFIGGGAGAVMSTTVSNYNAGLIGDFHSTDDSTGFSWMGTAGFSVFPVKWLALDLSYRYSGLNNIIAKPLIEIESTSFNAQEILLGLRVMIPDMYPVHQAPSYSAPPVTNKAPQNLDK